VNEETKVLDEPSRIEQQINRTRDRIQEKVGALEERLAPGPLVDDALALVRRQGGDLWREASEVARANPLPLAAIGIGVLWLLSSSASSRARSASQDPYPFPTRKTHGEGRMRNLRSTASQAAGRVADQVRPDAEGNRLQRMEHSLWEKAGDLRGKTTETMQGVTGRLQGLTEKMRGVSGSIDRSRSAMSELLEQQPLVVGAVGLAVGASIASMLPVTETEEQWLGNSAQRLNEGLREAAAEGYEAVREGARQTVDDLAGTGNEAGSSTETGGSATRGDASRAPVSAV
jgi:hypothetical protein